MTAKTPEKSETNDRWAEGTLNELLDEERGKSVDEEAFEHAKKAARDLGVAVNELEDPRKRSNQKIADLCFAAVEYGTLFAGVQLNHDMRRELLRKRGHSGDEECAKRLEAFHPHHMETLTDEIEDQMTVGRLGKLVSGTLNLTRLVARLGQVWPH